MQIISEWPLIVFHVQGQTWVIIQMYIILLILVCAYIHNADMIIDKTFPVWFHDLILTLTFDLVQVLLVQWPHFLKV